jgi:hypothetical protein
MLIDNDFVKAEHQYRRQRLSVLYPKQRRRRSGSYRMADRVQITAPMNDHAEDNAKRVGEGEVVIRLPLVAEARKTTASIPSTDRLNTHSA